MLLSVCIPTFNRCAFIRLSARYWLEQLAPFAHQVELIIADNASTDETVTILESYRDLGPFQLIRRTQHLTFNETTYDLVVVRARGEYVWVCGDDDYPSPTALAEVVAALQAHREQDHFYVRTQFVPNHYAPDVSREDPRRSPHIHFPAGDLLSRVVPYTREVLEFDGSGFSGFYSSIWRRPLAVEALSRNFHRQAPFASLEATLPYAVYVARHRLEKSCYRIGPPLLTVVHTIAWPQHASFFRLKTMPDLYDLYAANGVPRRLLRSHRRELLDHWPRAFGNLLRQGRVAHREHFSFSRYLMRNGSEFRFWQELFRYVQGKLSRRSRVRRTGP